MGASFVGGVGFGAVLSASLGACSANPGKNEGLGEASAELTTGQSFLVSFNGGSIPSNADAIVSAAGGSIVSRYKNLGLVRAKSRHGGGETRL